MKFEREKCLIGYFFELEAWGRFDETDACKFKIWANPFGLFLFIFVLFTMQFRYKLKEKAQHQCCGWNLNPWPQDGGPRAMAAAPLL